MAECDGAGQGGPGEARPPTLGRPRPTNRSDDPRYRLAGEDQHLMWIDELELEIEIEIGS